MTIDSFQSYSFSALTLKMTVSPAVSLAGSPATGASAATTTDRLTLSPKATAGPVAPGTDATATAGAAPDAPATPPAPPASRAERRAEALFRALDADEDGALTEAEFTEGAITLLRNAGARRRIEGDGEGNHGETRGLRRLERKLGRAFDRVDRDDDGSISKDELTAALARAGGRRRGGPDGPPPASPAPDKAATAATVSFSVTFVSVAMQRYSSVQDALPAA